MIGIECIASSLPDGIVDNIAKYENTINKAGLYASGFKTLRRAGKSDSQVDMCIKAFENLPVLYKENFNAGIILVNTSFSQSNLPSLSYQLHNRLKMKNSVFCFDVILGCTGFVQCSLILKSLMKEMGVSRALLFNVEKYSDILDPDNFSTEVLFSDAATVTVLSDEAKWEFSSTTTLNLSEYHDYIDINHAKLNMNAADLYKKLSSLFPSHLLNFLKTNNIEISSVDKFMFHQASLKIIEKFRKELGMDSNRIPFGSELTGNTGSCSIPLLLQDQLSSDISRIILSGFGSGLAISHMLLENKSGY